MAWLPRSLLSLVLGCLDVCEVCQSCRSVCKLWLATPVSWAKLRLMSVKEAGVARLLAEALFVQEVAVWTNVDLLPFLMVWPRLKRVETASPQLSDASLLVLAYLPELEELDLRTSRHVSDVGLQHLSRLSQLKVLRLDSSYGDQQNFGDDGLHHLLSTLTRLEKIELQMAMTRRGLRALPLLENLCNLDLHSSSLQNDALVVVAQCGKLERLSLARCLSLSDFSCLASLRALRNLTLTRTGLRDSGLATVCALALDRLNISECYEVTDSGLAHLSKCVSLQTLVMCKCQVSNRGVTHLAALQALIELDVHGCIYLTDQALDHIALLPVQELRISRLQPHVIPAFLRKLIWQRPNNASFGPLRTCTHLTALEVTDRDTHACLLDLWMLPLSLLTLTLCRTDIDDDALRHLARLSGLERLVIELCRNFTGSGLQHLRALLSLRTICVYSEKNLRRDLLPGTLPALKSLRWNGCELLTFES